MKLLNILFPVNIALQITDAEISALRQRAIAYLDTEALPTEADRASLGRFIAIMEDVQRDRVNDPGENTVFSAKTVYDMAILSNPVLNWAEPLPDSLFVYLNLLMSHVPLEIPQSQEASDGQTAFIDQLEETANDPDYVATLLARIAERSATLSPAEQQRPRRVKITMVGQTGVDPQPPAPDPTEDFTKPRPTLRHDG